jgi:hypothetical protein
MGRKSALLWKINDRETIPLLYRISLFLMGNYVIAITFGTGDREGDHSV